MKIQKRQARAIPEMCRVLLRCWSFPLRRMKPEILYTDSVPVNIFFCRDIASNLKVLFCFHCHYTSQHKDKQMAEYDIHLVIFAGVWTGVLWKPKEKKEQTLASQIW